MTASDSLFTIEEINQMELEMFESLFGNVIELCPDAAFRVGTKRPFANLWQLCEAFAHYLDSRTQQEKVNILCLHPDLGTRRLDMLTPESTREQVAAGLDCISKEERKLILYYSGHYREKFGFPFIICARENKLKDILDEVVKRYNNHYTTEITNAIEEVKKICKLRVLDIAKE